jgi:hypothetical protein
MNQYLLLNSRRPQIFLTLYADFVRRIFMSDLWIIPPLPLSINPLGASDGQTLFWLGRGFLPVVRDLVHRHAAEVAEIRRNLGLFSLAVAIDAL